MNEVQYIDRFLGVVDNMRVGGAYSATVLAPPNLYSIASDVETFVNVNDYVYFNVATRGRVISIVNYKTFIVDAFTETLPLVGTWKSMSPYADYGTTKKYRCKIAGKKFRSTFVSEISIDSIEASRYFD